MVDISIDQRYWNTVNFLDRLSSNENQDVPCEIRAAAGDVYDYLYEHRMKVAIIEKDTSTSISFNYGVVNKTRRKYTDQQLLDILNEMDDNQRIALKIGMIDRAIDEKYPGITVADFTFLMTNNPIGNL